MRRLHVNDPWAETPPSWGPARRLLAFTLTLVAVGLGIVLGRMSAPLPTSPHIPAQVAGATRMTSDVPVGYGRTRDGAVAAATNYTSVLAGPLILDPTRYRVAEKVIASPSVLARLTEEGEQAIAAVDRSAGAITEAKHGVRVVIRYTPIAYRLTAYDDGHATVSIWGLWLVGVQGTLAPTETWSTRTVVLEWIGGDWKLADSSTSPGPTPRAGQQPAQTSELPPQLSDFKEYAHASR
jgi:hypothetical protein